MQSWTAEVETFIYFEARAPGPEPFYSGTETPNLVAVAFWLATVLVADVFMVNCPVYVDGRWPEKCQVYRLYVLCQWLPNKHVCVLPCASLPAFFGERLEQ